MEYKSRSTGTWILAKVQGYDQRTGAYKLDVQPNAKPERIRPKCKKQQTGGTSFGEIGEEAGQARIYGGGGGGGDAGYAP